MAVLAAEWEAAVDRPHAPVDEVHVWRARADREGLALREVLARYLDEDPAAIELRRGEHGKPALADPSSPLRFNLSHSGDLALVAVAQGREVGVDIERIRPRRDLPRLTERALDPAAAAAVRGAPADERAIAFHQAWARREAIAKCLGTGLGAPLPPSPVAVGTLHPAAGYAAALAVTGDEIPSLRHFALPPRHD
jgi:4'-phosphopantetheinyl transferase